MYTCLECPRGRMAVCREKKKKKKKGKAVRKTLTSGLGLDDMSFAWPAVVQLLVFIYSGIQ